MENRIRLRIGANSPEEKIGFWFRVWEHPFLQGCITRVVTESLSEFGEYRYPKCIGPGIFGALLRNVKPMNLLMNVNDLMVKYSLGAGVFQLISYSDATANLAMMIKTYMITNIMRADPVNMPTTGFDYWDVQKRMTGMNRIDRLWDVVQKASSGARLCWTAEDRTECFTERPMPSDRIGLIFGGEGDQFVVYDAWSDRMTGGTGALDPMNMTQLR